MSTRDRLLTAATKLFSAKGFAGASTDGIVRAARVNKRMLYHHFGDKDGLFQEVLLRQWQAFAICLAQALQGGLEAEAALDTLFDFVAQRPEFVRLAMWDGLNGGKASRAIWVEARQPLFEHVLGLLGRGAKAPAKRRDELAQAVISMLGATVFYFAYAPSLADVLGVDPLSAASLQRRRAHLRGLLRSLIAG